MSHNESQNEALMNQLTIRGFDNELAAKIRQLALKEGISLNKAALRLLRRGAGLGAGAEVPGTIGASLDHLIGSWTEEEADEVVAAVDEVFGTIDEELWR